MDNQGVFKTCLVGGFEKESVLSFIEQTNKNNAELLQEKDEEISKTNEEKSSLYQKLEEMQSEIDDLQAMLKKEKSNMKTLNTVIASVNVDLEKGRQNYRRLENENILTSEKYKQLQEKYNSLLEREQNSNEASVQLGSLLLEAQKTAESIVSNANIKAGKIEAQAEENVKETIKRMEACKLDFTNVKSQIEKSMTLVDQRIKEVDSVIDSTLSRSKNIWNDVHEDASVAVADGDKSSVGEKAKA